ncbi:MAG: hypothetical protein QM804_04575 [Propionicimonas sp.]
MTDDRLALRPPPRRPLRRAMLWAAAAALVLELAIPVSAGAADPAPPATAPAGSPTAQPVDPTPAESPLPAPAAPDPAPSESSEPAQPESPEPTPTASATPTATEPPASPAPVDPTPTEPSEPPAEPEPPADQPLPAEPVELPAAVALEGVLRVTPIEPEPAHHDDHPHPMPTGNTVTLFTADGTAVELTGAAVAKARTGDRFRGTVSVDGVISGAVEDRIATEPVPEEPVEVAELVADASAALDRPLPVVKARLTTTSQATSSTTAKAHTVDVIYVRAAGQPVPSTAAVDAMVARLSEFWKSESNGQLSSITRPSAVKSATVSKAKLCDPDWLWGYASGPSGFNRKPSYPGYPADSYYWGGTKSAHLLVLVPDNPSCQGGTGLGTIGDTIHRGGVVWASVLADPLDWDGVVFHEVGHNLGLGHSNATTCTAPAVDGTGCEVDEYLDYYDVMGGGFIYTSASPRATYTNSRNVAALNVTHKAFLNALPRGSALREVRWTDNPIQRFTLAPASGTTGLRGLEVVDPLTNDKLYVEYRSGTNRDANSFYTLYSAGRPSDPSYAPGVRVLKRVDDNASTVLRRWADGRSSLSYRAGTDFRSRTTNAAGAVGVRISVLSTAPTGAEVEVIFESQLQRFNQPVATIAGTPNYHRTLTATLTPAWSPAPDTTSYQWLRGSTPIAGATGASYRVTAADLGEQLAVRVTARKSGYATATATAQPVPVTWDWTPLTVSGTVSLPTGVPTTAWQDLRVRAFADDQPAGMPNQRETTVSTTGTYTLANLPPGRWRLQVIALSAATDVAAQSRELDLETDTPAVDFSLTRSRRIAGTVALPAGAPASWLNAIVVTAYPEASQPQPHAQPRSSSVTPDAAGGYQLSGLDPGAYHVVFRVTDANVPLATMYYNLVYRQAERTVLTIGADDLTGIDTTMARLRSISGRVTLPAGQPTAWFAAIRVTATGSDGTTSLSVPVDPYDGDFTLTGLLPDRYTVCTAIAESPATDLLPTCVAANRPDRSPPVDVRTGDQHGVSIAAVSARTISGKVSLPPGAPAEYLLGTSATAYPLAADGTLDEAVPPTVVDADGHYELAGLYPGRYLLRFDPGSPWDPQSSAPVTTGLATTWYPTATSSASGRPVDVTEGSVTDADLTLGRLPVPSAVPTITGTPRIGVTLTAVPGKWDQAARLSYRWLVGGRAVPGATAIGFVPRPEDLGKTVTVEVTGSRGWFQPVTRSSAPTAKVLPLLPLTVGKPSISGTPRIGVTLTAKPGSWTSGTTLSYQWLVSGKAVTGATGVSFVPRKSDKGKRITVKVTGRKAGYQTATATSKSSSKVRGLLSLKTKTPKISGTAKVGRKLTAKPGKWTSSTRFSYQWLVSGKKVAGATGVSFVPRPQDAGRTIKVKVTGSKAGYKTKSKTSKATRKVGR